MATLRPVEERDAKGNTVRINPSITFKQDREIRKVVGRHDFHMIDNPDYHPPITVQVQNGQIRFFEGVPDSSKTRAAAKEVKMEDVPEYIIRGLEKHPIRIREARPTVYEVRIATMGDVEVAQLSEVPNDGQSVTITPTAPDLSEDALRRVRTSMPVAEAEAV